ncbi:MAG: trypsin-like peptidase domain-containing protein, partial [Bacteriovoracaceae bacterium]|nr:trypsin-like peptidase domain-containing protein [Bacteriovoracaceae bacterium]
MRTINVFILFMIMEFVNAGSFVVQTESLKKAIVTISVSQSINIGFSEAKTSQGTGFIVDKVGRIIATNKHLAGSAPCNIKIKFWDGKTTKGKIIYVDPYDDFSLIQYSEKLNYPELYLGDFYSQKEGQEVHLIGTNDGE